MTDLPASLGGSPAFPAGLPLVRPWIPEPERLGQALADVIGTGHLTNGPRVRELEAALADRLDVANVVAVSSCTVGLALVYQALGVRGSVMIPSFTFSASAHAVHWAGGTPQWVDIEPDRLSLDPARVAEAIEPRVQAVSATHIYGAPCHVDALAAVAEDAGVPLVLDAAHALGSVRHGRPVGSFGTAEVFSLSPTKVLVGGEGGLVATQDADLAGRLRLGREYGNPGDYDCRFPGLNARMSELHATTALHNLRYLDQAIEHRNRLVQRFADLVAGCGGIRLQHVDPHDLSTWKDLTVVTDPAATGIELPELTAALAAEGIDSRRYYHPPVHRQHAYADLSAPELPVTDRMSRGVVSLPLWSHMTLEQVERTAEALLRILAHASQIGAPSSLTPARAR